MKPALLIARIGVISLAVAMSASVARADIAGGGGSKKKDCLSVFDAPVNYPTRKPKKIRCTDGDVACDSDGEVNGVCSFPVAVCANHSTLNPKCVPMGVDSIEVDHAEDDGDPRFDPEFQAIQSRIDNEIQPPTALEDCTFPTNVTVRVRGPLANGKCRRGKKKLRLTAESFVMPGGKRDRDRDKLLMICDPAPGPCDAMVFFDSTFDRIQQQVFTPSCALNGCHDSEGLAGDMLLEDGTAYAQTVGVTPDNPTAEAAGLDRVYVVDPMTGDPTLSFLYRKITNDLDPGMGERMPLNASSLDASLIEIIRLWILAGAPETGWVPGTD
jgi:hypothetical protein